MHGFEEKKWYLDNCGGVFYVYKITDKIYIKVFGLEKNEFTFIACPEKIFENNQIIEVSEKPTKQMLSNLERFKLFQLAEVERSFILDF
jgi:hypothetical protein